MNSNFNEINLYITSLGDFTNLVKSKKGTFRNKVLSNNPVNDIFVYRGCSNILYSLLPGILRKVIDGDEHKVENDKYLALGNEKMILTEFINYASKFIKLDQDDYVHWAEYAQHYGLPTRFLDWTCNPLVALFFACRDDDKKDGCVWFLHDYNYRQLLYQNPDNNYDDHSISDSIKSMMLEDNILTRYKMPIIYKPTYVDDRMNNQKSVFMAWGSKEEPFEDLVAGEIEHIENIKDVNGYVATVSKTSNAVLFRVIIKAKDKCHILRELDSVGINEMFLFPGLDGIGKYVERKYRFNMQEMIDINFNNYF